MGSEPCILAEVLFLSEAEGGRRSPPQPPWGEGRWYMPHAVVEGMAEYLGVRFVDGPQVAAGEPGRFVLALMYHPRVDYSDLRPGVSFALSEGGRVVARGQVLEWLRK
jgi:hypothetical protein